MERSKITPWPTGCEGVVSLTFDDGLKSQLERAIPYMTQVGVPGTFYVNPNEAWLKNADAWREAAKGGSHEIGNHTLSHICSRAMGHSSTGLETTTLEQLEADVLEAERRLRAAIPEQTVRSFCYPCYYHHVGEGAARQSYVPVIAKHFVAGRGGTCNRGYFLEPTYCDLHYLESHPCETLMGYEMIGLCERAANRGHWCILTFHGIHEGHLSVADCDFRELCNHLVKHKHRLHVATVADVAQRIAAARNPMLAHR